MGVNEAGNHPSSAQVDDGRISHRLTRAGLMHIDNASLPDFDAYAGTRWGTGTIDERRVHEHAEVTRLANEGTT